MLDLNYNLTDEQREIQKLASKIAKEKILPVRAKYDETGEFPWDIIHILADIGFFGVYIPEEYGGLGKSIFELCIIIEELSKVCAGIATCYAASALGTFPILYFGTEAQKKKYLPEIAAGKKLAAFALTEPEAGSDASAIKTNAVKKGNYYVLNGKKQWITNGGEAEIYTVIALTDKAKGARGASAFILEKGFPGFSFGKKENKMGIRASSTRELIFEDCQVPAENLLGKEGMGFLIAMRTFDVSRPGIAAQAVGIAQGALEACIEYAYQRHQFGKPITSFQGIQFMLADMAAQIEAARSLTYTAINNVLTNNPNMSAISAMAKFFASDVAMNVTTNAVQIYGGYGYMKDYPVEKMMRDAKITQIYEGTNQIQREIVALSLIKQIARKVGK